MALHSVCQGNNQVHVSTQPWCGSWDQAYQPGFSGGFYRVGSPRRNLTMETNYLAKDEELRDRAFAAYCMLAWRTDPYSTPLLPLCTSGVVTVTGKRFVILRFSHDSEVVFRVRNDGRLRRLHYYPKELREIPRVDQSTRKESPMRNLWDRVKYALRRHRPACPTVTPER